MSEPTYDDFASVAAQQPSELRRLLREGDAAERVWAGWVLAIRIGREANPDLEDAARTSPTPGVRSLLLVILAGHGERELIEAFARDDPDDGVRASACRYLAAITSANDDAATAFLARQLERDQSSAVRAEILRLVQDGRLGVPLALLEVQAEDADLRVRTLAAHVLLREEAGGMPAVLRRRSIRESDDDLREALSEAWIAREGGRPLLKALGTDDALDERTTRELLARIAASGARFDWEAMRPFVGRGSVIDELVGRLLVVPAEPAALSWLLDTAARPLDGMEPVVDRATSNRASAIYVAAATAWDGLAESLPAIDPSALSPEDRTQLARLTEALAEGLAEERAMALEDDGVDIDTLPPSEQPDSYQHDHDLLGVMRRIVAATTT